MLTLAFVLLFMALFYQNLLSKRKRKEVENLLRIALESEKNERQRIAADLHDSVSSDLSAIRNYILHILKNESDANKRLLLEDLKTGVLNAIENTRLISYKLMPPLLQNYGFLIAVEDYLEQLTKKTNSSFLLNHHDTTLHISEAKGYELFRIIQEFTTNMLKYGNVKQCLINITKTSNKITVEIIDDGKSYNFKTALESSRGTGLKNIDSRIRFINGTLFQLDTISGNHFKIEIIKK